MGVASCFGNDVDTFYDRYSSAALLTSQQHTVVCCYMTSSKRSDIAAMPSGAVCWRARVASGLIDRFDASEFPTKFAAQIRNFSAEGCARQQAMPFA